jgi:hypothetical protein
VVVAGAVTPAAVVVSTEEVSAEAVLVVVGSTGEALPVAVSTALVVSVVDISPVAVSMAVAFVVTVLVGGTGVGTGAVTVSPMMSSSAATAFRGGAGTIHTDIMVTTITRTITMDTADTRTMETVVTVTTVGPVTDTAMAADQAISGVRGVGDKPLLRLFEIASLLMRVDQVGCI